ncbi:MAG: bifunctional 4-hydroxy-2-oxoglutarate aldolase/2-dehydro-3-deoxy-phosphogluconate aldolase [Candidatus Hydrogenedentota bacterium]
MNKNDALVFLRHHCITAVVRSESKSEAFLHVVDAIIQGGVRCLEIPLHTPEALRCLEMASEQLEGTEALVGAASVVDGEICRMAILSGAQYIVTPIYAPEVISVAQRCGIPVICGAYTPTEVFQAWQGGADMVKVFPASLGGPEYIEILQEPFPQVPLVPGGGVKLNNTAQYLKAGAAALAVGTNLVGKRAVEGNDYTAITSNAHAFAHAVSRFRQEE